LLYNAGVINFNGKIKTAGSLRSGVKFPVNNIKIENRRAINASLKKLFFN
jgi:hypothetical protein